MTCENCGEKIDVGSEYFYDKELDINIHLSCISTLQDETQLEKRYNED